MFISFAILFRYLGNEDAEIKRNVMTVLSINALLNARAAVNEFTLLTLSIV